MAKFLRKAVLLLSFALLAAAMPATAYGANGAYDTDGDGLIEINYLEQLDAVRSDLNGDGTPGDPPQGYGKGADTAPWFAAFPNVQGESACPNPCTGYELTRDLDFNDPGSYASGRVNPEWTSGGGWEPMVFGATFEGNGHTISNLYSNRPFHRASITTYQKKGGGLFEQLWGASTQRHDVDGIIANLGLVNVNITGENSAYALVGSNNGIIRNSYATGRVSANGLVGGLVAANSKGGRIIDSYADVDLETYGGSTFGSAGGLVGDNRGLIRGSHAQGDVMGLEDGVGGLVGTNGALGRLDQDKQTVYGTIESSYATGSVTGVSRSSDKVDVGGLVGDNEGIINRSYATGPVFAPTDHAGGLVGTNSGRITASYASGDVWAENHVGGLVGNAVGVIAGSYATGEVHGVGDLGGLVGRLGGGKIIGSYSTGPVVQVTFGQSDKDYVLSFGDYGSLVGSLSSSSEIVASYATGPISGGIATGTGPFDSSHPEAPENVRYSYWSSGARGPTLLANKERTAKLQSSVAYEGIYANWRVDVDNADGDDDPATGGDDVWDFGDGSQYPALKADLDGDGRATWQEFGDQPRDRPADASPPTTFSPSAWPERPYLEFALPAPNGRYDQDGDGLIEVNYLEQLDAIRHDLDGNGVPNYTANTREGIDPSNNWEEITSRHIDGQAYADAFPTATGEPVCRQRCHGYELARSLDFNDPASYASGAVNPAWTAGDGWASLGYYRINYSSGFLAIFEGNGFTINNLYIGDSRLKVSDLLSTSTDVRTDSYLTKGLIGYAGPTAQVRNLGLVDASIRETTIGFSSLGALVTVNEGIIGDCYATGSLQVAMPQDFDDELLLTSLFGTGGLVGVNQHAGEIRNSYATVTSSTVPKVRSLYERPTIRMGGLVGANHAFIRDSYATGDVSTLDDSSGGLGVDNTGIVLRSHATGNVSVEPGFRGPEVLRAFPTAGGGGLFAGNEGLIIASFATGDVAGVSAVGGLVGWNQGVVSSSYATGNMSVYDTGHQVWNRGRKGAGGLVGLQYRIGYTIGVDWVLGTFASYATGQVSGVEGVGGLVGDDSGHVVASYATGPVTGQKRVGGLVGDGGVVRASYSTGTVDGEELVGGLAGWVGKARGTPGGSVQSNYFNYWDIESSGITPEDPRQMSISPDEGFPGIDGKTTAELKAPTGYTGIYADWNSDLDNADGEEVHLFGVELDLDTARSNGADDFWDFGGSNHYPALKVDFDGDGIATWQEFGDQRPGASLPAPAGAPQPTAEGTAASATAAGATPAAQASSAAAPGATASASQAAEEREGTAVSATAERAAAADSDGAAAATPEPGSAAESGGGACGAPPEDAPPGTTAGSLLLLLAPLAMIGGLKWQARRRRDGGNVFFRRCA